MREEEMIQDNTQEDMTSQAKPSQATPNQTKPNQTKKMLKARPESTLTQGTNQQQLSRLGSVLSQHHTKPKNLVTSTVASTTKGCYPQTVFSHPSSATSANEADCFMIKNFSFSKQ
jgi:hypothetical protein